MDFKPIFMAAIFLAGAANATNRYVATTGSDTLNDCSVLLSPCLTVQHAHDQASAGDTINIAAGTYSVTGLISVTKTLTFLGAQAGVDARTRSGAESVLSNTQGISVGANNCVFDGLTIQDSQISAFTGYGLWINPGKDGTQVINNIFQLNIVGLGISNLGTTQCLVQHNLFQNNNRPGGAAGTGIYTDQFTSGAVSNVLINENLFVNNDNGGVGFNNTDLTKTDSNITVTNNVINNCGRGVYFFNTSNLTITDNTITNLPAPTDHGSSAGISLFGGASNVSILRNNVETGAKYGIHLRAFLTDPPNPNPPNTNVAIHLNNIFGFAVAGLHVDDAPVGPINYAICNWWGSATGPTNPTLNPGGTGDVAEGTLVAANFNPWLLGLAPDAVCASPPTLTKAFSPSTIRQCGVSTLVITLTNTNSAPANLTTPLIDNLPSAVKVVGASSTCGGTVTAVTGSSKVTLTGGAIPPVGSCVVRVKVIVSQAGTFTNTLPIGALHTDLGNNSLAATAQLTVLTGQCPIL